MKTIDGSLAVYLQSDIVSVFKSLEMTEILLTYPGMIWVDLVTHSSNSLDNQIGLFLVDNEPLLFACPLEIAVQHDDCYVSIRSF